MRVPLVHQHGVGAVDGVAQNAQHPGDMARRPRRQRGGAGQHAHLQGGGVGGKVLELCSTPLGAAVVPEVYRSSATSSGLRAGSGKRSVAFAIRSGRRRMPRLFALGAFGADDDHALQARRVDFRQAVSR